MKKILIYTRAYCSYCRMAKKFLQKKNMPFQELDLTNDYNKLEELVKKTNFQTVPQIFIDEKFIGGYEELVKLYKK